MIHCLSSRDMASRSSAATRTLRMASRAPERAQHFPEAVFMRCPSPSLFNCVQVSCDVARILLVYAERRHGVARHDLLRIADPADEIVWCITQHAGDVTTMNKMIERRANECVSARYPRDGMAAAAAIPRHQCGAAR